MRDYYHVVVVQADSKRKVVLFKDISKNEIKKKLIKPFGRGENLLIASTIYKVADIKKVQIIKTNDVADTLIKSHEDKFNKYRDQANNEPGSSVHFGPYFSRDSDIVKCGIDVTSDFITNAPSIKPSMLYEIIHNPWVVGIGTVLLTTLILWLISNYFGITF